MLTKWINIKLIFYNKDRVDLTAFVIEKLNGKPGKLIKTLIDW